MFDCQCFKDMEDFIFTINRNVAELSLNLKWS